MLDEPVSDFSTGWRMRLTLAVSMLKYADLVLLDEPTNHLDEESVEWLSTYIQSIKDHWNLKVPSSGRLVHLGVLSGRVGVLVSGWFIVRPWDHPCGVVASCPLWTS